MEASSDPTSPPRRRLGHLRPHSLSWKCKVPLPSLLSTCISPPKPHRHRHTLSEPVLSTATLQFPPEPLQTATGNRTDEGIRTSKRAKTTGFLKSRRHFRPDFRHSHSFSLNFSCLPSQFPLSNSVITEVSDDWTDEEEFLH